MEKNKQDIEPNELISIIDDAYSGVQLWRTEFKDGDFSTRHLNIDLTQILDNYGIMICHELSKLMPSLGQPINEQALCVRFAFQLVSAETRQKMFEPAVIGRNAPTPQSMELKSSLIIYLHHVLHGVSLRGQTAAFNDNFFGALIILSDWYTCHILGISRSLGLRKALTGLMNTDFGVAGTSYSGIDLLFHSFAVWQLGDWLLSLDESLTNMVAEILDSLTGGNSGEDVVRKNWCVTALLHDLGCCLGTVIRAWEMTKFLESKGLDRLHTRTMMVLNKYMAQLSTHLPGHESISSGHHDPPRHGLLAASHLQESLDKYADSGDILEQYVPAIIAIAKHDAHDCDASFGSEPLTCLLAICDEMADWHQSITENRLAPKIPANQPLHSGILKAPVLDTIMFEPPDREEVGSGLFVFTLVYKQADDVFFLPSYRWIRKCQNLQRLDFGAAPWRVEMRIEQPAYPQNTWLNLMSEYVHAKPQCGLSGWLKALSNKDYSGVTYDYVSRSYECIIYNNEVLFRTPLIRSDIDIDWDAFVSWARARLRLSF
ncbi:MAG: hypothetical protein GY845_20720 [Planctomycetes bacterium]|nr:hypothetical protein [Planctomycetota bacterium]